MHHIGCQKNRWSVAAILPAVIWGVQFASAAEPPADLCSLLPASQVTRTLGKAFDSPQKSVAPRPFRDTAEGTDCRYQARSGGGVWFRAYVDPSPSASAALFDRLAAFYSPPTPVSGLADQAYFDKNHGLHVRKGKVRYFLQLSGMGPFTPERQKQLEDLASGIAAQL